MLNADALVAAVLGAPWAVLDSARPSQGILLGDQRGHRGCMASSSWEERGMCDGHHDMEGGETFVFPSCNGSCNKDEQRISLHKVNLAVLFPSKFELVESLCYVNSLCCAAEFSFSSPFFFFKSGCWDASAGFTVLSNRSLGKEAAAADADMLWLGARGISQLMLLNSFVGGMCCGLAPTRVVGGSPARSWQPS